MSDPLDAGPVVVIDPGHGGMDGGTVGNGLVEKDWTLKVGVDLAAELRRRGHKVMMSRTTDLAVPLLERPALANGISCLALLSIHFNAGSPDASGVETFYSWPRKPAAMARLHDSAGFLLRNTAATDSLRLAESVQSAIQSRTGARDRGIRNRPDLAVTSWSLCPAVLVECGFLSNGSESRRVQEESYRKKLVEGIADGYEAWKSSHSPIPLPVAPDFPPRPVPSPETPDEEH